MADMQPPTNVTVRVAGGVRRLLWRLVRPFVMAELQTLRAEIDAHDESQRRHIAAVKKDLLATNHRITWVEEHGADERGKARS